MSEAHIFVVEDEESFVDALEVGLAREGFTVSVARDGFEALEKFDEVNPDLVLLDVMLPRVTGIEVCRQLRQKSTSEIDTVVGLEVGADDYVAKPYRIRELVARIRAALRRNAGDITGEVPRPTATSVVVGDIELNEAEHTVTVRGESVAMPLKEFDVLRLLMMNVGQVMTRELLIDRVWGSDYYGDTKTLDVHVKRVRAKIESDPANPSKIVTVRGLGYKFERPAT